MTEAPEMVKILEVRSDTPAHRTLVLDKKVDAKPGQFCMLWLPCLDEKPMSFSNIKGNLAVTVRKLGRFTREVFKLSKGDSIGFRGPYGNGFKPVGGKVMVVGGGCGIAPLIPLVRELAVKKSRVFVFAGSKTREECLIHKGSFLRSEIEKLGKGVEVLTTTDSKAREKEMVTIPVELSLKKADDLGEKFRMVYACGPEVMMKKVLDLCVQYDTECQLSLERYMKCGVGLCGSCMLSAYRVCKDGPVFTGKQLEDTEFGEYTRSSEGRKINLQL